jgi:hypothetical protein
MYNEVFSSVFYSTKHDSKSLVDNYDQDSLFMIYSDGIDLAIRLEHLIENYESLKKSIKSPLTQLLCHRIHLIEQLFVVKRSILKTGFKSPEIFNNNYEILYN